MILSYVILIFQWCFIWCEVDLLRADFKGYKSYPKKFGYIITEFWFAIPVVILQSIYLIAIDLSTSMIFSFAIWLAIVFLLFYRNDEFLKEVRESGKYPTGLSDLELMYRLLSDYTPEWENPFKDDDENNNKKE